MKEGTPQNFNPGLRFIHLKGSIFERSIGRVGSLPFNILSPSEAFKNYPEEKIHDVTELFQGQPWNGHVDIYLNHAPFKNQVKRLFDNDRRTNILARATVSIPATGVIWSAGKLFRRNSATHANRDHCRIAFITVSFSGFTPVKTLLNFSQWNCVEDIQ
ncbi:MAG: hypothetical protein HY430_01675 [Candidatus Levybacteria bacterium]|nr:hypothetical protein [Candidatus Levybacteria bacterium]